VLGSKNVKGIAAWGDRKVAVARPEKYHEHLKKWTASLKNHPIAGGSLP